MIQLAVASGPVTPRDGLCGLATVYCNRFSNLGNLRLSLPVWYKNQQ